MSKSRNVMAATAQNVTTTLRRPKLRGVVALAALAVGLVGPALPAHAAAAPDAPTAVVATPSGTSLSVAFTPGSTNGASGVSYAVDCTGTGPAGSASGSGSPIVVSGLGKGQTYTCTVTAQSDEGPSAASDPSDPEQLATTAPGAPSIDGITLGSSSVTVDFSAPADNGGDAITGYAVTCDSAGDHPAPVSGAGMSLTVGSLVTGDSYTCTVHATNGVGDGSESAPSESFVAATAPGAPSVTSVTQINPNSLRVAFTPGSDNNDPITGYRVTCTSSNGGITRTKSGGDSPITVTNLSNAKTYTCKVVASNSIGNSPASNASDAKPAAVLPGQPSITSATRGSNSVRVAFTPTSRTRNAPSAASAPATRKNAAEDRSPGTCR